MKIPASLLAFILVAGYANDQLAGKDNGQNLPNVVLIMTDDQGIGDFGVNGNPVIRTPFIDAMAKRSASVTNFYVSPVCSPTRACLMTGRYNYRTRCIDTFLGRSMMDPEEITIAEMLGGAGYNTGVFGKWHLGDCYPMRPMDQGFEMSLVHRGGGLGQPSEPRENQRRYTDAILFKNGEQVQTKGYCTDVYFDAAMDFIKASQQNEKNFFAYIATNAPHSPYHDVPMDIYEEYLAQANELGSITLENPQNREAMIDRLARIAAMITNIDANVGRLMNHLEELELTDNTIVIFMLDNGPNSRRYVMNLRGMKSEVFEGGVRSACWVQWPDEISPGHNVGSIAAHIDIAPTILDACEVDSRHELDGRSLLPMLTGDTDQWEDDRHLVIQTHRGDEPVRYHHFMIRQGDWKLLHPSGFGKTNFDGEPEFQLYNLVNDPGEKNDLASENATMVSRLKKLYDQWFDDVSSTRSDNYAPPRIVIGSEKEAETVLTRQDWRSGGWGGNSVGHWEVEFAKPGNYTFKVDFDAPNSAAELLVTIGDSTKTLEIEADSRLAELEFNVPAGPSRIACRIQKDDKSLGAYQVFVSAKE